MTASLVVFDLDGTLVDSSADLAAALNRALARLAPGSAALPVARVRTFIGSGARILVERGLRAVGARADLDAALPVFLEEYRRGLLVETVPYPGVLETLDALADRRLAVLTNKPGDMSREILEGLGLAGRFAAIYGGGDLPARKPDPVGLRRLLEEADLAPERAALVGDSAIDAETGRAGGVLVVGVSYGFDPDGLRAAGPDLLLDDLRDLPAALGERGL